MLMLHIPIKFENNLLTIKALKLSGIGISEKDALMTTINNTAFYEQLCKGKFETIVDHRGRTHNALIVPFNDLILREVLRLEPFHEDKLKHKGLLASPTSEETIKFGF